MWNEFNIKTFPAETIVYRNGKYVPDLSTMAPGAIISKIDLPVHIIYVGEIADENKLNIDLSAARQNVFLSIDLKIKKPAFLNIFIKNAGKNSEVRAHVVIENNDNFGLDIKALHAAPQTTILATTKLVANKNSSAKLSGTAEIETGAIDTVSDISFAALADESAKISFLPAQRIRAVPKSADHGAAIYTPRAPQIQFLRGMGLSGAEVDTALREAFTHDLPLF